MPGYYTERLAAERLRACYDLAPPRTKAYLEAEIEFVLARTTPSMLALELGCGYGRVLERLSQSARSAAAFPRGDAGDAIRRAGDVFEVHSSILGASTGMV